MPLGLAQYSQSIVSCKRMIDFFTSDELPGYVDTTSLIDENNEEVVISMNSASLGWLLKELPTSNDAV